MEERYLLARNCAKKANRAVKTILPLVCLLALSILSICLAQGSAKRHVLIYTKNGEGYVHNNIPASVASLKSICEKNNWTYEVSEDASIFTPEKINSFDVLVFSNTNNEVFDTNSQRDVFQNYVRQGGGFVGIHSACGSERDWPWFWANLGGKFLRHPKYQKFDIKIIDSNHPSTCFLNSVWKWEDECYYLNHLNPDIHVLLAADLTTRGRQKKRVPWRGLRPLFPSGLVSRVRRRQTMVHRTRSQPGTL
jgi:type 1 glutamine amidotransferase